MPEIGGKWVLVHVSDNTVWIIKDAIWENQIRISPWNIWHAKYLDSGDSKSCCVKWVLTDLQPMREQDTGQWEVRGGVIDHNINNPWSPRLPNYFLLHNLFFLFFFALSLQISAQTICIANFLRATIFNNISSLMRELLSYFFITSRVHLVVKLVCGPDRVVDDIMELCSV